MCSIRSFINILIHIDIIKEIIMLDQFNQYLTENARVQYIVPLQTPLSGQVFQTTSSATFYHLHSLSQDGNYRSLDSPLQTTGPRASYGVNDYSEESLCCGLGAYLASKWGFAHRYLS